MQNFTKNLMEHVFYRNIALMLRPRASDVKQRDTNVYDATCRKNRNLLVAFCKMSYTAGNRLNRMSYAPYSFCS